MMYRKRRRIRKGIAVVLFVLLLMGISATYDGSYKCPVLNTMAHASLKNVRLPEVNVLGYELSDIRFPDISFHRLMCMLHKPVVAMADLKDRIESKTDNADALKREERSDDVKQAKSQKAELPDITIRKEDVKNTASALATGYFNFFLDLIDNKYNNTDVLERFVETYTKKGNVIESKENEQSDTEGT